MYQKLRVRPQKQFGVSIFFFLSYFFFFLFFFYKIDRAAFHSVPLKAQHSNQFSTYHQLPVYSPISSLEWNWPQLLCLLLATKLNSGGSINSHLWWHGLYPLFLSLFHSWRSLRGWCGLDQTSDDACWIWTVIRSLFHGYSDSLPSSGSRSVFRRCLLWSLRFCSPWWARCVSLVSPHALSARRGLGALIGWSQRQSKMTELHVRTLVIGIFAQK